MLDEGHAVLRPALRGYERAGSPAWRAVSATDWLADLDRAWAECSARHPEAAPSLLGFSMGGLLGMAWSLSRGIPLRRAILISPAFRLKWYAAPALSAAGLILPRGFLVPSRSPKDYALHGGTSLSAYGALLALVRHFSAALMALDAQGRAQLPRQFIAYARRDEMVSAGYLRTYRTLAPERITLHRLEHRPRRGFPHHLGIDAHTLDGPEWAALRRALSAWLAG